MSWKDGRKRDWKGVVTGRDVLPPVNPHQDIYTNDLWDLFNGSSVLVKVI